ncbi:ATPase P-type K/Mg/Cd/Cu/Zn/Na/Ca/Na/H-transporter [Lasiodiplodia theobromae]|uniref:Cation-transporting ATPase n=1 Tax=Lasiodiplodia theobromae TaxID=45133 RepID=A0A5N5DJ92_9PEZI|nr:ATPAse P-type K/Mg/Cd/Cu/Zn/Na/Ca/Na/H-transporter [Lasiodiplodia theobromae]KAB2576964.1 putative cation-transporting ATPase [Lasiodiplodia theobromae]KAF4543559.1 ATPAse P-type K/Mg/Cd/Cu/Zn/Na/Ca/Na/H-transporter [Lasiodiplodia theobromae]KAF9631290.1 ATPase P-type K/Mg/Cd/Cu/Zn/Na/Ca/Na/H-transporter [Lasiodiplodia theobromae]
MVVSDVDAGGDSRRSSYAAARRSSGTPLYRQSSNMSDVSLLTDVPMAQDEIFSGPMSESVPTSVTGFAHRQRSRADSTVSITSFTFYDDERDSVDTLEEEAIAEEEELLDDVNGYAEEDDDLESGHQRRRSSGRRKSSTYSARSSLRSRGSDSAPLLRRGSSSSTQASGHWRGGRSTQKIYIATEDLTIVVAGFRTSVVGFTLYLLLCILTAGLGYLVFRWLPGWRIKIVGKAAPLHECDWVVIENQWGEMAVQNIGKQVYGQSLSSVFGIVEKGGYREYDEDDDPVIKELRTLDYRYIRFCYHPVRDKFILGNTWKDPAWTDVRTIRDGLDNEEKGHREQVFGKNLIDIEEKSTSQLLVDEAFHPFYVFQIASLILWSLDEYYYYAACIFVISVVSITTTLIETKATMRRLREVSRFECDIRVLRNGFWRYVESSELVPGDIYEITDPNLTQFPCDSLLLSGDCIVNESMLTGESVPVSKVPTTNESLEFLSLSTASIHPEVARHFLFCGTKIIRARRPQDDKDDEAAALALVVRTGFNTTKGALVRSMLFPKPSGFKFYRDSFKYISVMAMIAGVGFIVSFVNFVRLGLAWHLIVVRALDLITIVVPPALPATLTIGTNFALNRLKKKQIYCISPQRVNVGGKLDVVCFDKTGTLTEEGLDVLGLRVVQQPANNFSDILTDCGSVLPHAEERLSNVDYKNHRSLLYTMATCHSLRSVDGELVGDPLDVKMFDFTSWQFEEGEQSGGGGDNEEESLSISPSVARPPPGQEYNLDNPNDPNRKPIELGIIKAYEFVSQLRRASVVVRQFGDRGGHIYVKGAPECMKDICRPDSFPPDYEELLSYYTHRGFRVIACATKTIPKLNWVKVQKMKREEAESDLNFVGFIIFENKLKPTTTGIINELAQAGIRKVMCTGDNILTAISVARECNLIDKTAHCFVPHFVEGDARTPLARLSWESIDNPAFKLDENTLKPLPPPAEEDASLPYDISNLRNYSVAVSGDVFRWIIDYASEKVLREMLVCGQVFARMSPDEKHELVEKLQSIDYCCGFCGDGANDCGALKAADVGISLSEAEASVAAPFTSRVFDISCVPEVIREGRAALVTSFSCFKYMSLYSAIQFTSVSFLYASASNLGDFQFLYIDLLLILPIAIFMGWTGAYPVLSRKRPTASLVSRKVLTPLLGQIALCVLFQAVAFQAVRSQPWFVPPVLDRNHSNSKNSENTALFLLSCYQYILSAIVLSIGKPFRRPMLSNAPFVFALSFALVVSTYMLLFVAPDPAMDEEARQQQETRGGYTGQAKWLYDLMELTPLSWGFKAFLLVLGFGGFAIAWCCEKYVFLGLARLIGRARERLQPGKKKKRKEYKIIAEGMAL